jgi:hypothetical protein
MQVQACMVDGAPALADRSISDVWWGITRTINVTVDITGP